ncbi:MAG TPA: hypothetical protein VFX20_17560 [Steroidobacteraceae bacterium]|nr:hypothetical protein [Steroidobacteraceae bacterium]
MRGFLLVMSGWLAATIFCTTLIVPWGVDALHICGPPRRRFMTLHLALGVAVLVVGLAHGMLPISSAGFSLFRKPALVLGLSALVLLLLQAALGTALRSSRVARPQLRGAHVATMLVLAGVIVVHILVIRA